MLLPCTSVIAAVLDIHVSDDAGLRSVVGTFFKCLPFQRPNMYR